MDFIAKNQCNGNNVKDVTIQVESGHYLLNCSRHAQDTSLFQHSNCNVKIKTDNALEAAVFKCNGNPGEPFLFLRSGVQNVPPDDAFSNATNDEISGPTEIIPRAVFENLHFENAVLDVSEFKSRFKHVTFTNSVIRSQEKKNCLLEVTDSAFISKNQMENEKLAVGVEFEECEELNVFIHNIKLTTATIKLNFNLGARIDMENIHLDGNLDLSHVIITGLDTYNQMQNIESINRTLNNTHILLKGISAVNMQPNEGKIGGTSPVISISMSSIHFSSECYIRDSVFQNGTEAIAYTSVLDSELIPACYNILQNPGFVRLCPVQHNISITNSTFTENVLPGSLVYLYVFGNGAISIDSSTFTNNLQVNGKPYMTWTDYFMNSLGIEDRGLSLHVNILGYTVSVKECDFVNNRAQVGNGPAIYVVSSGPASLTYLVTVMNITSCTFISNNAETLYIEGHLAGDNLKPELPSALNPQQYGSGGAIYAISSQILLTCVDSLFHNNSAGSLGGAAFVMAPSLSLGFYKVALFINTTFTHNKAIPESGFLGGMGGAVWSRSFETNFEQSTFSKNLATFEGGAVYTYEMAANFRDCYLEDNMAFDKDRYGEDVMVMKGGAISYQLVRASIIINNSTFINNFAYHVGGTIASDEIFGHALSISNSQFYCCAKDRSAQEGRILKTGLTTTIVSTLIEDVEHYNPDHTSIVFPSRTMPDTIGAFYTVAFTYFKCAEGLQVSLTSRTTENGFALLILTCEKCPNEMYSIVRGQAHFLPSDELMETSKEIFGIHQDKVKIDVTYTEMTAHQVGVVADQCVACPYGGYCPEGSIIARPNFWGYKDKEEENIKFVTCPSGYCCDQISTPCTAFNTCAKHREGRLCGKCVQGFTETLITNDCVPDSECKDTWLWIVFAAAAFVYLIWYSYKDEVWEILLFPAKEGFFYFKRLCTKLPSRDETDVNSEIQSSTCGGSAYELSQKNTESHKETKEETNSNSVDKAYFSIIVYFVNIMDILTITVELPSETGGFESLLETIFMDYVVRFINLDIYQLPFNACPYSGLQPAFKAILKPLFVLFIYSAWVMSFTVISLIKICLSRKEIGVERLTSIKQNLLAGLVETVKYGYSGLAGANFILLTCVHIGGRYYWFYNAENTCFQDYQYYAMVFLIITTLPFPVTLILGMALLKAKKISVPFFLISCLLPLPCLLAWLILYSVKWKKSKSQSDDERDIYADTILSSLQGPYREDHFLTRNFEGIIEGRRFLFSMLSLITNNIVRMALSTVLCAIVALHHIATKPFQALYSNYFEGLSLFFLTIIGVSNSCKAVYLSAGLLPQSGSLLDTTFGALNRVEMYSFICLLLFLGCLELYLIISAKKRSKRAKVYCNVMSIQASNMQHSPYQTSDTICQS